MIDQQTHIACTQPFSNFRYKGLYFDTQYLPYLYGIINYIHDVFLIQAYKKENSTRSQDRELRSQML